MNLAYGKDVYTCNDVKIGIIKELVIDPRFRMVTHLIIQEGLLFNHDRLMSVEYVTSADDNGVHLSIDDKTVESLSNSYSPEQYLELNDAELQARHGTGGAAWIRPVEASMNEMPYHSIVPPGIGPIPPEPEIAIPLDEIMLEQSAPVRDCNGELLGRIDECLTDDDDKIIHFIIAEGDVFTEKKRIPIDWVREIRDNEVIIAIDKQTLEKL